MIDDIEEMRKSDPDWMPPSAGDQRVAIVFSCESPADVDALYEGLTARGVAGHKTPWDAFWGQRCAQVKDPDGHVVDLFAPLEPGE